MSHDQRNRVNDQRAIGKSLVRLLDSRARRIISVFLGVSIRTSKRQVIGDRFDSQLETVGFFSAGFPTTEWKNHISKVITTLTDKSVELIGGNGKNCQLKMSLRENCTLEDW